MTPRRLVISDAPRTLLRKLRSTVTGRPQVYAALSRFSTVQQVRRYGRIVAVSTRQGWKVRDAHGRMALASPGQARVYDHLAKWSGAAA